MSEKYLLISPRGQITIPKRYRKNIKVNLFSIQQQGEDIILRPVKTREDFLEELEERHAEWKEKGGTPLAKIKKEHGIS